jgi:hypothetical protein
MSTIVEVRAAEESMRRAQDALQAYTAYVDKPAKEQDFKIHRQLAAELKAATDIYVKAVLDLNSK